ncbi:MAG: hypothetical protein AAGJ08_15955 [Cyanobacteria bacterium P01_H01_bin.35]
MNFVHQAIFSREKNLYQFYPEIPLLPIVGAPSDANWQRWSMLHDGSEYRMYCFKGSTSDTLYQFTWDGNSYRYGHNNSYPKLNITGIPDDADTSSFSMLYGQEHFKYASNS